MSRQKLVEAGLKVPPCEPSVSAPLRPPVGQAIGQAPVRPSAQAQAGSVRARSMSPCRPIWQRSFVQLTLKFGGHRLACWLGVLDPITRPSGPNTSPPALRWYINLRPKHRTDRGGGGPPQADRPIAGTWSQHFTPAPSDTRRAPSRLSIGHAIGQHGLGRPQLQTFAGSGHRRHSSFLARLPRSRCRRIVCRISYGRLAAPGPVPRRRPRAAVLSAK